MARTPQLRKSWKPYAPETRTYSKAFTSKTPNLCRALCTKILFKEYDILPATKLRKVKNYTDTADEGADFLCSITYLETEIGNFILDVLYTAKPMEYTEPKTAEMLTKHAVELAVVESNNGGRGFARNVEKQARLMGNNKTRIKWFHQSQKQSRTHIYA